MGLSMENSACYEIRTDKWGVKSIDPPMCLMPQRSSEDSRFTESKVEKCSFARAEVLHSNSR